MAQTSLLLKQVYCVQYDYDELNQVGEEHYLKSMW